MPAKPKSRFGGRRRGPAGHPVAIDGVRYASHGLAAIAHGVTRGRITQLVKCARERGELHPDGTPALFTAPYRAAPRVMQSFLGLFPVSLAEAREDMREMRRMAKRANQTPPRSYKLKEEERRHGS